MGLFTRTECTHIPGAQAAPAGDACSDCGSTYNLRMCADCGKVSCCESQAGHNRDHARASGHPVIRSLPLSEGSFTWCYECRTYV